MQIRPLPVKLHLNAIPTPILLLCMQRLVNISNKMQHKPQTLPSKEPRQILIHNTLRMISNSRNNTTRRLSTVTRHIDAAGVRWVVGRVDVVPLARVREGGDVRDLVGKEGGFADVLAIEEVVGEACGGGSEVEGGEVGDSAVAEGAPGCGEGNDGEQCSRQDREEAHHG